MLNVIVLNGVMPGVKAEHYETRHNDNWHYDTHPKCLNYDSQMRISCDCPYTKCHYAECHSAEWRYARCLVSDEPFRNVKTD
jgi:hypothetical protein